MKRSYKYRLYPTKQQEHTLFSTLNCCREIYNVALQERREAYRMVGKSINYYEQAHQLPEIKQIREEYQGYSKVSGQVKDQEQAWGKQQRCAFGQGRWAPQANP